MLCYAMLCHVTPNLPTNIIPIDIARSLLLLLLSLSLLLFLCNIITITIPRLELSGKLRHAAPRSPVTGGPGGSVKMYDTLISSNDTLISSNDVKCIID